MSPRLNLLVCLLCLTACTADPTATDPVLILEDGFVSGLENTAILDEGGTITGGFDAWLKLLPDAALRLRYEDDFSFLDCSAPSAWFNRALQEQILDPNASGLVCLGYTNPAFDFPNGRWYVEDRSSGYAYYRVWKTY